MVTACTARLHVPVPFGAPCQRPSERVACYKVEEPIAARWPGWMTGCHLLVFSRNVAEKGPERNTSQQLDPRRPLSVVPA